MCMYVYDIDGLTYIVLVDDARHKMQGIYGVSLSDRKKKLLTHSAHGPIQAI